MALGKDPGSYTQFEYTGGMQQADLIPGLYKLEVWGGSSGSVSGVDVSNGGYSVGYLLVSKKTTVFVCVGGKGGDASTSKESSSSSKSTIANGGYNGGGSSYGKISSSSTYSSAGGGATHIALMTGTLAQIGVSNKNKILIVAGGAGGCAYNTNGISFYGGPGGGLEGGRVRNSSGNLMANGGTQTGPGSASDASRVGGFGYGYSATGSNFPETGGGGGLYGGNSNKSVSATGGGGGGSGYIDGVPALTFEGQSYSPSMTSGANSGNGKAIITLIQPLKLLPTMYIGDQEVSAMYFGDTEVDTLRYGDLEL